jgi:mannan endo-1,6-alpha-mannosidase
MCEEACEPTNTCDTDQLSFKAYLSRWMVATVKLAPFTNDTIMPRLKNSAIAAADQCDGGTDGVTCGLKWTQNKTWDGTYGVGQQIAALQVIQANLIENATELVTSSTGGTNIGNSAAGVGSPTTISDLTNFVVTTRDKAGAGILTIAVLCGFIAAI